MNDFLRRLLMLPEQGSTMARSVDSLHYFVILTTMAGAAGVALVTFLLLLRYREGSRTIQRERPPGRRAALGVELMAVGGLLGLFVFWWVIGFGQYARLESPPPDAMPIYVTAKQWMWSFAYPGGGGSKAVLYVPVGRPVELIMTSRDVIHSFYVPAFRVKQDVVPGRATTVWFEAAKPGRYPVYCAEYCGTGHSTMRAEVVALSGADYEERLAELAPLDIAGPTSGEPAIVGEQSPARPLSLAAVGQRVAARRGCLRCHTLDGTPHVGPTWAGLYRSEIPLAGGGRVVADEAYLTESMMEPLAKLHLGFLPVMPSYRGFLSPAEVGALVELIRSLGDKARGPGDEPLPQKVPAAVPLVQPLPPAELEEGGG